MKGVLDPHHTVPASKEKILELFDIVLCPVIGHIVDHDLEYPVEHPAGNDVAELIVQLWDVPALSAQDFHETLGGFHFDFYHVVDKVFIACALCLSLIHI